MATATKINQVSWNNTTTMSSMLQEEKPKKKKEKGFDMDSFWVNILRVLTFFVLYQVVLIYARIFNMGFDAPYYGFTSLKLCITGTMMFNPGQCTYLIRDFGSFIHDITWIMSVGKKPEGRKFTKKIRI